MGDELDDLKLMASGIGVTMTPMPVYMIRCAFRIKELLNKHPEFISEIVCFAIENCGEQYYTRATMARALSQIDSALIEMSDMERIRVWIEYEQEELVLKDLKSIKLNE